VIDYRSMDVLFVFICCLHLLCTNRATISIIVLIFLGRTDGLHDGVQVDALKQTAEDEAEDADVDEAEDQPNATKSNNSDSESSDDDNKEPKRPRKPQMPAELDPETLLDVGPHHCVFCPQKRLISIDDVVKHLKSKAHARGKKLYRHALYPPELVEKLKAKKKRKRERRMQRKKANSKQSSSDDSKQNDQQKKTRPSQPATASPAPKRKATTAAAVDTPATTPSKKKRKRIRKRKGKAGSTPTSS
jgi:hypothetical protein